MDNYICFLITVLYGGETLECALKVDRDHLPGDWDTFPMEPENRQILHRLLPHHVRSAGPIIKIETIFEVHCA